MVCIRHWPTFAAIYQAGELLPVHAVAGPTRVRSHFEAQDCLESGADHRMTSGWLNRAVAAMPAAASGRPEGDALAIGVSVPLLLRGSATVGNWAPHGVISPSPDLYTQIAALNQADKITGPAIAEGLRERGFTGAVLADDSEQPAGNRYAFPALARAAGEMLRAADGPRIAAAEIGGWDTHVAGPAADPRAEGSRRGAGGTEGWAGSGLATDRCARDDRVRPNRSHQRNQGNRPRHRHRRLRTGGAVAGGRVAADWPGLGSGKLLENRDLQPTRDSAPVARVCWRSISGLGRRHSRRCFRTARGCSQWPV